MAKKIVDETLKFNIIINGDSAKKEYGQLERAQRKILNANEDLEAQAKKLEKANKSNTEEYKKLRAEIDKNNTAYQQNEKRLGELTKEIGINNLSMRQLGKEARKLSGIMGNLDPNSEEWSTYNKQLQAVRGRMANLREEMRPVAESMDDQIGLLENLGVALGGIFAAIKSGNYAAAAAGFTAMKTAIKGATTAAWAFIATPLGATLTALAGIIGGVRFWANYNEGIKEAQMLTEQLTGLQGANADAARRQAKAMEETYGADFKEILTTANGLVRDFDITFEEALNNIEKGLQMGQNNNNEYFDSLKEYDTFFSQAGFSADEFRRVIQTGFDLGVYTDKLPDAIKEMDISLREQTTATVDALKNAFGAAFTDDLLNRIKTGRITTKQALQEISKEAHDTGINVQQNAQLTADLFRGAGEDAGGAIKIFEAYNIALNQQERALSPLEERLRDVAQANKELAAAQDEALKSDNYLALSNNVELFWIKTKTAFYQGVDFVVNIFTDWGQFMTKFWVQNIATIKAFPSIISNAFSDIKNQVFDVIKTFAGMGDVIENLMDFNFTAAKESFNSFQADFKNQISEVGNVAKNAYSQIATIRKNVGDAVDANFERNRVASAARAASPAAPTSGGGTPVVPINPNNGNSNTGGGADTEQKNRLDAIKRTEQQITDFIAQEQQKRAMEAKVGIERELAEIDAKYAAQLQKAGENEELRKQVLALKGQEINDLKVQKAVELADRLTALDEENYLAQEDLRLQREAMAADTQAEKDAINMEREQLLATHSLKVEEDLALQKLELAGATEEEITAIKRKFALKREQIELNQAQAKNELNKQEVTWAEMTEEQKYALVIGGLGAAAGAFNEGSAAWKAMKIAETTIATYQGATNAFNSLSVIPVVGPVLGALAAAAAVSAGLANVSKIASTPVQKIPKPKATGFEDGLYPVIRKQDNKTFNARFGGEPSTQIVSAPTQFIAGEVAPEMIIDGNTFKKMDPSVTDYILRLAGKSPGFENGLYPDQPQQSIPVDMLVNVINSLNERLDQPIVAETYYGAEASMKQQEYDKRVRGIRENAKIKKK